MDKKGLTKIRIGAGTQRYKIEQLEQLLQQKNRQLAKLKKTHQVLAEREQVVSACINAQVDLLAVIGQLAFSLPHLDDAAYEAKATAAVQALLKDMEVAQLMQAADSITTCMSIDSDSTQHPASQAQIQQQQQHEASQQAGSSSTLQQQQQQQQQQKEGEPWTIMIMRSFLESPDCMARLRTMSTATAADLADTIRKETMAVGFAVARYPSKAYVAPAAVAELQDASQRRLFEACNTKLHGAIDDLGRTIRLLNVVADRVLGLSTLNLETLQPETPPASFWEDVAAKLNIPEQHMAQLHTGFLIYNSKRSELTSQMQQTMAELQQLLKPLTQEHEQQQLHNMVEQQQQQLADVTQQVADALRSGSNSSSSGSNYRHTAATGSAADQDNRAEQPQPAHQQLQPAHRQQPPAHQQQPPAHQQQPPAHQQPTSSSQLPSSPPRDMLECMEDADQLLQQLSRQVWALREASRCFIFHFANVVDPLQMSLAAVHSWPFIMQPPPIIEVLVKQQVAWQQEARSTDEDED